MWELNEEEFGEVEELNRGFREPSSFENLPKEKGCNIFPFSKHICSYVKSPLKLVACAFTLLYYADSI